MKLHAQLPSCVALLDWFNGCFQSVRERWTTPYGEFATEPLRIEVEAMRGVDSAVAHERAGRPMPLALRLKNGRVYVGSRTVRNHADLWDELHACTVVEIEEIADLGFWQDGAYCPSKPPATPST